MIELVVFTRRKYFSYFSTQVKPRGEISSRFPFFEKYLFSNNNDEYFLRVEIDLEKFVEREFLSLLRYICFEDGNFVFLRRENF